MKPSPQHLPKNLIEAISSMEIGPRFASQEICGSEDHPLHSDFIAAMELLPAELVEQVSADSYVHNWIRTQSTPPRYEVMVHLLEAEIYARRKMGLLSPEDRPPPYDHPALADIEVDNQNLVRLREFEITDLRQIVRNGYVFTPAPPLPAINSQSWATNSLLSLPRDLDIRVRLDPLLVSPIDDHRPLFFKMLVYGQELDWNRLFQLHTVEHARWMPDELTTADCLFTEVVWNPRDDELHFECEEVPKLAESRPSRYFHSILDPNRRMVTHLDSAVRFFDSDELEERKTLKLHNLGKVGRRIKLFRVDGEVPLGEWADIVASTFIWNNDLERYFRNERAFDAEHSPLMR